MIEFAVIGAMVLGLILVIVDLALLLYNDANLHSAAQSTARLARISQNETAAVQTARIRARLCSELVVIDCADVQSDLRRYTDLGSVSNLAQINDGNIVSARLETVQPRDLIFFTVVYQHRLLTPLGFLLASNLSGTVPRQLIVASVFTIAEAG